MEITWNQVHGVPLTKQTGQEATADVPIYMEENVGYGDKRNNPQISQDEYYEYISLCAQCSIFVDHI